MHQSADSSLCVATKAMCNVTNLVTSQETRDDLLRKKLQPTHRYLRHTGKGIGENVIMCHQLFTSICNYLMAKDDWKQPARRSSKKQSRNDCQSRVNKPNLLAPFRRRSHLPRTETSQELEVGAILSFITATLFFNFIG
jgi:hypothetical protein